MVVRDRRHVWWIAHNDEVKWAEPFGESSKDKKPSGEKARGEHRAARDAQVSLEKPKNTANCS